MGRRVGAKLAALEAPAFYTWDPVQRHHSIGGIRALAFSPDGLRLTVGGSGKISNIDHLDGKALVEVYDWQKGKRTHEFVSDKFKGMVEYLGFAPHGSGCSPPEGATRTASARSSTSTPARCSLKKKYPCMYTISRSLKKRTRSTRSGTRRSLYSAEMVARKGHPPADSPLDRPVAGITARSLIFVVRGLR